LEVEMKKIKDEIEVEEKARANLEYKALKVASRERRRIVYKAKFKP